MKDLLQSLTFTFTDTYLIKDLVIILGLMIANTIFRVGLSIKIQDFNFKQLIRGMFKGLFILLGVVIFYWSGTVASINEHTLLIQYGETQLTIPMALDTLAVALMGVYVKKCFDNLKDIFRATGVVLAERKDNDD